MNSHHPDTMNTQRSTPRTDAHIRENVGNGTRYSDIAKFARELESEVASKHGCWMLELRRVSDLERELAEAQAVVKACMAAMPIGNIQTHTPENLAARIGELASALASETSENEARRERDTARDERDIARIPICIGKPLIQILAKEGQWTSENGNGLVAADCLFRNDPYAENEAMRAAIQETLMGNLHLADGDVCTLKRLKDVIGFNDKDQATRQGHAANTQHVE